MTQLEHLVRMVEQMPTNGLLRDWLVAELVEVKGMVFSEAERVVLRIVSNAELVANAAALVAAERVKKCTR